MLGGSSIKTEECRAGIGNCYIFCKPLCSNGFILFYYYFLINLFIYLFLSTLGLPCCVRAFFSCGEQGLLFVAVPGLLIAVASLVAEHGL